MGVGGQYLSLTALNNDEYPTPRKIANIIIRRIENFIRCAGLNTTSPFASDSKFNTHELERQDNAGNKDNGVYRAASASACNLHPL